MEERLQKILAAAGVASRREAEKIITAGRVRVNGKVVTELGCKFDADKVRISVDGKPIAQEAKAYYMFYKPRGVVTTMSDPQNRRSIADFVQNLPERVFPVGRLDFNTEGLLLLTNDGALAHELLSPRKHVDKTYFVRIAGNLSDADVKQLEQGMDIGDEKLTLPAKVSCLEQFPEEQEQTVMIKLREGRYHQVKRMFAKVGHPVLYLQRVSMGTLTLDDSLKTGEYRKLTADEIAALKR